MDFSHLCMQRSFLKFVKFLVIYSLVQITLFIYFFVANNYAFNDLSRRTHLIVTFEFLMLLGSWYLFIRCSSLIRLILHRWTKRKILLDTASATVFLFLFLTHVSFAVGAFLMGAEPHWLSVLSFICLAAWVHLFISLLVVMLIEKLIAVWLFLCPWPRFRRRYADDWWMKPKDVHTAIGIFMAFILTIFGMHAVSTPPIVRRVDIYLKKLPPQFDGTTIALATDFHIGATVGLLRVRQAVDIINSLNPDIIAIAGDLFDGPPKKLSIATAYLKNLKARFGKFYATGNHEYFHADVDEWFIRLTDYGVTTLHNAHVKVRYHKNSTDYLCVAGVDDMSSAMFRVPGHGMNITAALTNCGSAYPKIVLVHQPNAAKRILDEAGSSESPFYADLILSGHTHGGQLYLFAPIVYLANAYYRGLYRHEHGAQIFVSSGVYYWGPPVKIYGFSEVVLITLKRQL